MSKYYSPSRRGFYDETIHGERIPADAVEINDELWRHLIDNQCKDGAVIVMGPDGRPTLAKP